mmetsp:Transcript_26733/g.63867  ORF Transcript_26733/g.63867 Transcript_26733/m.63867 type:complete len:214 (-) Transcript_26733:27-668(-)
MLLARCAADCVIGGVSWSSPDMSVLSRGGGLPPELDADARRTSASRMATLLRLPKTLTTHIPTRRRKRTPMPPDAAAMPVVLSPASTSASGADCSSRPADSSQRAHAASKTMTSPRSKARTMEKPPPQQRVGPSPSRLGTSNSLPVMMTASAVATGRLGVGYPCKLETGYPCSVTGPQNSLQREAPRDDRSWRAKRRQFFFCPACVILGTAAR